MLSGYETEPVDVWPGALTPLCYLCGEKPAVHTEHVHPVSLGGSEDWTNLGAACEFCNLSKGSDPDISSEAAERWAAQQQVYKAAAKRCQAVGSDLLEDVLEMLIPKTGDLISQDEELADGAFRDELVECLADAISYDVGLGDFFEDCEPLARHVVSEWLLTPQGKEFDLLDDRPPMTPAERNQANADLLRAFRNLQEGAPE